MSIEKGSKLWNSYDRDYIGVNSFHHQNVKDPGKNLKVVVRSSDGLIEDVEHDGHVFAAGVQWHSELIWQQDRESLKLFEAFVEAAALG